jgi:phenylacetate-CoA ligase
LIEEYLRGPVFDYYGSRDAGAIAGECRARAGLHVFSDLTRVEVLRDDGSPCPPGEAGEVVVTNLHEHAMPLIRYRTGDRAFWLGRGCSCPLGYPLLSSPAGRLGDFIRAPSGREIHGEFFTHLFYGIDGVARFQVRQIAPASLEILVQACGTPDAKALERVREASADRFGAPEVALKIVDMIEPGPSGKHRFVLPLVQPRVR